MSKRLFPSLPDAPDLSDTLLTFPGSAGLILLLCDDILLRDSDLSIGERELIAAYVSALNACAYCYGSHKRAAEAFDVDGDMIEALVEDAASAPVDDRLRPILAYAEALTLRPAQMTEAMAQAVYEAGWSEAALYDAIQVCALFSFMNRIIEGTGIAGSAAVQPPMSEAEKAARRARKYADWGRSVGLL